MVAVALLLLALSLGGGEQQTLAGQVLRLHVLANSDSEEDQALKLQVRDAVLACAQPLLEGATSQQEAEAALSGVLGALEQAGTQTVRAAGYDYPVTATLETDWFPTRTYEDFSLPAGYYPTLRVEISGGRGAKLVVRGLSAPLLGWRGGGDGDLPGLDGGSDRPHHPGERGI